MASTTYRPPIFRPTKSIAAIDPPLADADRRLSSRSRVSATSAPEPAQTGIWVCVCAIFMCFAAFTSALVVREGSGTDWRHFVLPRVLYFNTFILLASSYTVALAQRRIGGSQLPTVEITRSRVVSARWLFATLMLGLLFIGGQFLAWRTLAAQGLFLATNPSSSFFYVLTATHGLHVLGGLAGLIYAAQRLTRSASSRTGALKAAAIYWHFMDVLWIYLLVVMSIRM
jgi:cytochrome c oxidase subunit 3